MNSFHFLSNHDFCDRENFFLNPSHPEQRIFPANFDKKKWLEEVKQNRRSKN